MAWAVMENVFWGLGSKTTCKFINVGDLESMQEVEQPEGL